MPIDPAYLELRAPQIQSPLQSIGQLMQMRDTMSQVALRQAQTQHAQQQAAEQEAATAQKNQQLHDQNLIQQHFFQNPADAKKVGETGDYSMFRGRVSEGTINALTLAGAESVKNLQAARTGKLANDLTVANQIGKTLDSLKLAGQKDPAKLPEFYQSAIQNMTQEGLLKDLPAGSVPPTINSMDDLNSLAVKHGLWAGMTEAALKREKEQGAIAETAAGTALKGSQKAEADVKVAAEQRQADASLVATALDSKVPGAVDKVLASLPPERAAIFQGVKDAATARHLGMTPEQQVTTEMTAQLHAMTAAHQHEMERQGKSRLGIEGARLNLEREKAGFDMAGGISTTAKAIANGDLDPATVRAMLRRMPGLIGQVKAADPNFDEANIEKRYNTLKEFTSSSMGKAGGQVLALNTLIHHADLYMESAEALKNGTFRPGNAIYNRVATAFGAAPPTQANLVAQFFAGETGKVATGGVPAEGEIKRIVENLGSSNSPDQIKAAGGALLQLAAGRSTSLIEKVKDAKLDNVVHVFGPSAQEILTRRGMDPQTMKPISGGGGGGMIRVQIPGHPPGQIPADQKDSFLKTHPDGKVL